MFAYDFPFLTIYMHGDLVFLFCLGILRHPHKIHPWKSLALTASFGIFLHFSSLRDVVIVEKKGL